MSRGQVVLLAHFTRTVGNEDIVYYPGGSASQAKVEEPASKITDVAIGGMAAFRASNLPNE